MTNPKGAWFERKMADYLAEAMNDPDIDRQVKAGARDKGDIRGVKVYRAGVPVGRVAVECKNTKHDETARALREVEAERKNLGAIAGIVIAKRHGKGKPEDQLVIMTAADFVALITGEGKR